ncbi:MAG: class I SAM-dependent methyltransferase [Proteobacteria bacterium]|nr:class I SAM-dependent methyltransferase [Pseudomonadota bacterium]
MNRFSTKTTADPFTTKYLFLGGNMPSIAQIGAAVEKSFVMEDWSLIGPDYDKTLIAWFENFDSGWHKLKAKYGERFYRLWKHYLPYCAGSFRARHVQLWQIVFSKHGITGGYETIRRGAMSFFLLEMRKSDQWKNEICLLLSPPTKLRLAP